MLGGTSKGGTPLEIGTTEGAPEDGTHEDGTREDGTPEDGTLEDGTPNLLGHSVVPIDCAATMTGSSPTGTQYIVCGSPQGSHKKAAG